MLSKEFLHHDATEIPVCRPADSGTFSNTNRCLREPQGGDFFMSATTDKVKGAANEAIGKAKQGVGEATGSDRLQGEGAVQEVKGKGQQALGDAKQATKDAVNRAAAEANKKL
jgi:uncharacterized protein YjbJ (UPF0337 family)